ncbi:MAG: DUF4143 domain-containing protein [Chitinivibrionales bacterium]|nr:DUF4143 domain-containing protein [Chitinivibrionales bacterium]
MHYHNRFLEKRFSRLLQHFPAVVVTGARQVGKTTMIEHCTGDMVKTITFDPAIDIGNARAEPEYFLQNTPTPVFLDEIQYAPELLGPIKRIVDKTKQNGRYILSGSQNLSVMKDIAESLAGRAAVLNLMGMSQRELDRAIDKPSFLHTWLRNETSDADLLGRPAPHDTFVNRAFMGGYPGVIAMPPDLLSDYWASYTRTYIERDVRRVADISNLQRFSRFFKLLAALSACEINHNQLGRELSIDRNTALAWTEIARATYQWYSLPAFSRNPAKKIARKEKGFFADTGFLCYLLAINSPLAILSHPNHGAIFETFVVLEILKSLQEIGLRENLYHFRTYGGAEVDCVIEHDGRLYLIEIKATTQPGKKHAKGFQSFRDVFPREHVAAELIICAIEEPLRISESCLAVPWWVV